MKKLRCWIVLLGIALTPLLAAQTSQAPPDIAPVGPYTDKDSAARQPTMQELGLSGHMDLAPMRERAEGKPRDWRLQALVGQMEHLAGNRDAAEARYQRAVDAAGTDPKKLRHVMWSRGWARLYSGDNEGAMADWRDAARLHGGKPEWLPHTIALAHWRSGRNAEAIKWFDASRYASMDLGEFSAADDSLPRIAQGLIGDILSVRDARADPDIVRLPADSPEYTYPSYVVIEPPRFPRTALLARASGDVMLRVCVDQRGKSRALRLESGSGNRHLDSAALEAVRGARFRPATCGGKPVETEVFVPILFRLVHSDRPPRFLKEDPRHSRRKLQRDSTRREIGLDPSGYRLVARDCKVEIVCADLPESSPPPVAATDSGT